MPPRRNRRQRKEQISFQLVTDENGRNILRPLTFPSHVQNKDDLLSVLPEDFPADFIEEDNQSQTNFTREGKHLDDSDRAMLERLKNCSLEKILSPDDTDDGHIHDIDDDDIDFDTLDADEYDITGIDYEAACANDDLKEQQQRTFNMKDLYQDDYDQQYKQYFKRMGPGGTFVVPGQGVQEDPEYTLPDIPAINPNDQDMDVSKYDDETKHRYDVISSKIKGYVKSEISGLALPVLATSSKYDITEDYSHPIETGDVEGYEDLPDNLFELLMGDDEDDNDDDSDTTTPATTTTTTTVSPHVTSTTNHKSNKKSSSSVSFDDEAEGIFNDNNDVIYSDRDYNEYGDYDDENDGEGDDDDDDEELFLRLQAKVNAKYTTQKKTTESSLVHDNHNDDDATTINDDDIFAGVDVNTMSPEELIEFRMFQQLVNEYRDDDDEDDADNDDAHHDNDYHGDDDEDYDNEDDDNINDLTINGTLNTDNTIIDEQGYMVNPNGLTLESEEFRTIIHESMHAPSQYKKEIHVPENLPQDVRDYTRRAILSQQYIPDQTLQSIERDIDRTFAKTRRSTLDVESICSTYSNVDNIPAMIKEVRIKNTKRSNNRKMVSHVKVATPVLPLITEGDDENDHDDDNDQQLQQHNTNNNNNTSHEIVKEEKHNIIQVGPTGIVVGVMKKHREQRERARLIRHGHVLPEDDQNGNDDDDEDDEDDDDDDTSHRTTLKGMPRPRNQTKEEKKLWKAQIKAERAEARQRKRDTRQVYKKEIKLQKQNVFTTKMNNPAHKKLL